jgi:hypothetical protein
MMNAYEVCSNFPMVRMNDEKIIDERNIVEMMMEDGSGYSWNLKLRVNDRYYNTYVRFISPSKRVETVVIEGVQVTLSCGMSKVNL